MKALLHTLAAVLLFCSTAAAQRYAGPPAVLRVRLADGAGLTVEVDGRRYDRVDDRITIGDLPAGRHYLRVYRVGYAGGRGRMPARLVWEDRVRLSPATITSITIDSRTAGARIRVRPTDNRVVYDRNPNNNNRREDDWDRDGRDWNDYRDDNDYRNNDRRDNDYRNDDRYDNDRYNGDRRNGNGANFSNRDMDDLRTRVADRITDGDKLNTIRTAVGDRMISTVQVRTMMGWLSFESTRVELAKWGYGRVVDPQDYWKLESEFTFQSSKDELAKVIGNRGGGRR